jgi:hypothetical protein
MRGDRAVAQDNAINILRQFGPRKIEQKLLPLDDILLDPSNVRFRHLGRPVTDKEAEETLWREKDSKTLYQEILVAGGLSEPIYVRRDSKKFIVKEGNRRVTCLRHGKREAAAGRLHGLKATVFDFVPAFILDDGVTAEEEAILEARWHVMGAGKKQWPAFNQSAHIWAMHHSHGMPVAKISDVLGMSRPTVNKRLRAYEAMVEYQSQTGDEELNKFSYFDEAYKAADIVRWLDEDDRHLDDLIRWVHLDKFDRTGAKDLRQLTHVLKDQPARETFESKGFDAAYSVFTKAHPDIDSVTFRTLKEAIDALEAIPRSEMALIKSDRKRQKMLEDIIDQASSVLRSAGVKRSG